MKKHICVLFCFRNTEHIKKCFNSLKTNFTEFFIVENQSENSIEIQEFFLDQALKRKANIIGYYQFMENITNNAMRIFLDNNKELLEQYEYITISDCDLYVENSEDTFNEIFKNLHFKDVLVSCVDLTEKDRPMKKVWKTSSKPHLSVAEDYIECVTGIHLMTILNENLYILYLIRRFKDSVFHKYVRTQGKKWVKTIKNKADHLTWELCVPGSEYVALKVKLGRNSMWNHDRVCAFTKII